MFLGILVQICRMPSATALLRGAGLSFLGNCAALHRLATVVCGLRLGAAIHTEPLDSGANQAVRQKLNNDLQLQISRISGKPDISLPGLPQ